MKPHGNHHNPKRLTRARALNINATVGALSFFFDTMRLHVHDWRVGVIRRVNCLEGDQQRVGMPLLGATAVRVTFSQNAARSEPAVQHRV